MKIIAYTSFLSLAVASVSVTPREDEMLLETQTINSGGLRAAAPRLSKVHSSMSLSSIKLSNPQLQTVVQFLGSLPSLEEDPEGIPPCAEMDMGPDMPADFQALLCRECGTEIDEVVSCAVGYYESGEDVSSCEACFDDEEMKGEKGKEEEEAEDVPVDVWCPYVQGMDEVIEACQDAEECVTKNCGTCAPKMEATSMCIMTKVIGCDICANAGEALFGIA